MPQDLLDPDDSSNLLGDFVGTVLEGSWSTPRAETQGKAKGENADRLKEYWTVRVDEVLQESYDGPDVPQVTVSWGIGNGWAVEDNDYEIRHEDDPGDEAIEADEEGKLKPVRIKASSGLGQFLGLITGNRQVYSTRYGKPKVMDGGDEDVDYDLTGCSVYLRENGLTDSRDCRIFNGCQFRFRGLGLKYDAEQEPWMNPLPTEFLGVDKEVASGVIDPDYSPEGGSETSGTVDTAVVAALLPADTDPKTVESVAGLVRTSKTFNKFMKDALLIDGVEPGTELGDTVMDETNGPWSARG